MVFETLIYGTVLVGSLTELRVTVIALHCHADPSYVYAAMCCYMLLCAAMCCYMITLSRLVRGLCPAYEIRPRVTDRKTDITLSLPND